MQVPSAAHGRTPRPKEVTRETYREEREQHPGGDHDLTVPQPQPDLENQLFLKLRPGFPFPRLKIRCKDTALCQVTAFQVKVGPGWHPACAPTWWPLPQEARGLQREPAQTSPIQRYGLEPRQSLQGQMKQEPSVFIFTKLLIIR